MYLFHYTMTTPSPLDLKNTLVECVFQCPYHGYLITLAHVDPFLMCSINIGMVRITCVLQSRFYAQTRSDTKYGTITSCCKSEPRGFDLNGDGESIVISKQLILFVWLQVFQ